MENLPYTYLIGWSLGLTKETSNSMKLISEFHRGVPKSEEHRIKISKALKGMEKSNSGLVGKYKRTPEILAKRSASRAGYVTSQETRNKISESLKGKRKGIKGIPATETTKKKMSMSRKGKPSHKKGKKTFTDGITIKFFISGEEPAGWFLYRKT